MQQIILECGLWSGPEAAQRLCSCLPHLMHRPQTLNGRPLGWQSQAVSFHQLPLSSVPEAPHLTTVSLSLPGKIKQLLPCQWTIPVPHPTCSLFSAHPYADVHGRVAFVNLGCQAGNRWPSCGEKCMLYDPRPSQLLYGDQWCEVHLLILYFYSTTTFRGKYCTLYSTTFI